MTTAESREWRVLIARCLTFYLVTICILLFSMPLWKPYLSAEKSFHFGGKDEIRLVVENGQYDDVRIGVSALSKEAQREIERIQREGGPLIPDATGALMSFEAAVNKRRSRAPSDVYVVFDGLGALALESHCSSGEGGERELITAADLPERMVGFLSGRSDRKILRLRGSGYDGDPARLDCDLPDSMVWAHDRQKNYFKIPKISVMTWEIKKRPPGWDTPRDISTLFSAKTCTNAGYTPESFERLETIDSRVASSTVGYNGEREWETCKGDAGFFGSGGDDGVAMWTAHTPMGLFGFVAIGENAEDKNQRDNFLAGIFLGLAAALAVEAIAATFELMGSRPTARAAQRRRTEPGSQATPFESKPRTVGQEHIGARWEAWKTGRGRR